MCTPIRDQSANRISRSFIGTVGTLLIPSPCPTLGNDRPFDVNVDPAPLSGRSTAANLIDREGDELRLPSFDVEPTPVRPLSREGPLPLPDTTTGLGRAAVEAVGNSFCRRLRTRELARGTTGRVRGGGEADATGGDDDSSSEDAEEAEEDASMRSVRVRAREGFRLSVKLGASVSSSSASLINSHRSLPLLESES